MIRLIAVFVVLLGSFSAACAGVHASPSHVYEESVSAELAYRISAESGDHDTLHPTFIEYEVVISRNPHMVASLTDPFFNLGAMPACTERFNGKADTVAGLTQTIERTRELIERRYRESTNLGAPCNEARGQPVVP